MNKTVFQFDKYTKLIELYVSQMKERGAKYTYQKLAEQIGVQKSYFSKVLAGQANLNSDQFFNFLELTNFDEEQRSFAELLLAKSRCANPERLAILKEKISEIKKKKLKTEEVIKASRISDKEMNLYYIDSWAQIVHMSLTIKKFRNNPMALSEKLSINEETLMRTLNLLEELGLVTWSDKKIQVLEDSLHMSKDSPYFWAWRNQVVGHAQRQSQKNIDAYNFSVFFSSSPEIKEQVHSEFLNYLKKVERLVSNSPSENLYQMNFDLVPWF